MSNLATLADASSLLLGLDRKLTRVQVEPRSLPTSSPIPGTLGQTFGENTRGARLQVQPDAGYRSSTARFESEYQFVGMPCDPRDAAGVIGEASRLAGRAEMLRKSS